MLSAVFKDPQKLRICQQSAAIAAYSHFLSNSDPAIISLPTGAGKTALIGLLHAIFESKNTLVVTPTRALRKQTARKLLNLDELKKYVDWKELPKTVLTQQIVSQLDSEDRWNELLRAPINVLTPQVISPYFKDRGVIEKPETVKVDLIIVDEAHHSAAPSWLKLIEYFPDTKIVMLTATPFRRDRRTIPARLIFSYSISAAYDSGIYCPIDYVEVSTSDHPDLSLCRRVSDFFKAEAKILVRTNRIALVQNLKNIYVDEGFEAFELHSDLDENTQISNIDSFEAAKRSVLVVVDIGTEGLDIPGLNAVVLHSAPKSIPATIQLVGRIARKAEGKTTGYLFATRDLIYGPVADLYRKERKEWKKILASFFDKLIVEQDFTFSGSVGTTDIDLISECKPNTVARVFRYDGVVSTSEVSRFQNQNVTADGWEVVQVRKEQNFLVVLTFKEEVPKWMGNGNLVDAIYDIHIYCRPQGSRVLFQLSTDFQISEQILSAVVELRKLHKMPFSNISHVTDKSSKLVAAGVRSISPSKLPKADYKTHFGSSVAESFAYADRFSFAPDFGCGLENKEVVGFSAGKSKIWSLGRRTIDEVKTWCHDMARVINLNADDQNSPLRLMNVASVDDVRSFFGKNSPMGIVGPTESSHRYFIRWKEKKWLIDELDFRLTNVSKFEISARIEVGGFLVSEITFSLKTSRWEAEEKRSIVVDQRDIEPMKSLDIFFREFPLRILMRDGRSVTGPDAWKPSSVNYDSIFHIIESKNWNGIDIKSEVSIGNPSASGSTIFDRVFQFLVNDSNVKLITMDNGSGEFADFVTISSKDEIYLFHCKFSSEAFPGTRVKDIYEVGGQGAKSIDKIMSPWRSLENLVIRIEGGTAKILKGKKKHLCALAKKELVFRKSTIILVIPGLSRHELLTKRNQVRVEGILSTLLSTVVWIESHGHTCKIWSSP